MPANLTAIEALDERILNLCTRISAATYELLVVIREFDKRGGCQPRRSRVFVAMARRW